MALPDAACRAENGASTKPVAAGIADARAAIRSGRHVGYTRGLAPGSMQCGVAMLPRADAYDFLVYCLRNPRPLPIVEVTEPGSTVAHQVAPLADLRTDVPRYGVWRDGALVEEPTDIRHLWRDDLVTVLLGCSLTFDAAMLRAGLPYRQQEEGGHPTMYTTGRDCVPAGRFRGRLVVSMRPMLPEQAIRAVQVTSRFPATHGAPIHIGDPAALGIADPARPEIGRAVTVKPGEVCVFWACIATIWETIRASRPPVMITHAPGCMFITDTADEAIAAF